MQTKKPAPSILRLQRKQSRRKAELDQKKLKDPSEQQADEEEAVWQKSQLN